MDTKKMNDGSEESVDKSSLVFGNLVVLIIFVLLVGGVYMYVSKKSKSGQVVFPAGVNYLAPNSAAAPTVAAPLYDYAKMASTSDWLTFKGKLFPYSFQYPKDLKPLVFPNDKTDAVAFKLSALPAEQSLFLTVETISSRDPKLVGKPKEFVSTYWKYFSGLKGLNKIEDYTNEKGLVGYKATYLIKGGSAVTSDFYFFTISGNQDNLLHVGNTFPSEGQIVFNRIINSLDYKK